MRGGQSRMLEVRAAGKFSRGVTCREPHNGAECEAEVRLKEPEPRAAGHPGMCQAARARVTTAASPLSPNGQ